MNLKQTFRCYYLLTTKVHGIRYHNCPAINVCTCIRQLVGRIVFMPSVRSSQNFITCTSIGQCDVLSRSDFKGQRSKVKVKHWPHCYLSLCIALVKLNHIVTTSVNDRVLWFQFGFINYEAAEEGKKLFFHMTEVHDGVEIQAGDEVEFVVVQNQRNKKYSACSVRKIT